MIRRLIILLLIVGCVFAQDEYPYFSDMAKQMEFEKQRIYINKVAEKEQYISGGGSEFNWLSLLNPYLDSYAQQPMYLQGDIKTNYRYSYNFELVRNNEVITEIDLLYIVGLDKEAQEIIDNYNQKLDRFKFWQTEKEKYQRSANKKEVKIIFESFILSIVSGAFLVSSTENLFNSMFGVPIGMTWLAFRQYYLQPKQTIPDEYKTMPVLKQTLSEGQLESIAESYNRQLFQNIQSN